jgi:hypothetical protein
MENLKQIIEKVEHSNLTQLEKDDIYLVIRNLLHSLVWPILIKHMPKDQLNLIALNILDHLNPDTYFELIQKSLEDGKAIDEIGTVISSLLVEIEKIVDESLAKSSVA